MDIHLVFVGLGDLCLTEQMNLEQLTSLLPPPKHATNPMAHVELLYHRVNRNLVDADTSKSLKGLTESENCRKDTSRQGSRFKLRTGVFYSPRVCEDDIGGTQSPACGMGSKIISCWKYSPYQRVIKPAFLVIYQHTTTT